MTEETTRAQKAQCYRFGIFEADAATGELRRKGLRVKLNTQPFQLLLMLLDRPSKFVTREEIQRELWPDGTFVDFEHGVNSAVNRIREALGDSAANPRFLETLARRGYRFIAPVERVNSQNDSPRNGLTHDEGRVAGAGSIAVAAESPADTAGNDVESLAAPGRRPRIQILSTPEDLPKTSPAIVQTLFALFQLMYLGFYVGALANLAEIRDLMSPLPNPELIYRVLIVTAAILIPVRAFVLCAALVSRARFPWKIPEDLAVSASLRRIVVACALPAPASHQLRTGVGLHDAAGLLPIRPALVGAHGSGRNQVQKRPQTFNSARIWKPGFLRPVLPVIAPFRRTIKTKPRIVQPHGSPFTVHGICGCPHPRRVLALRRGWDRTNPSSQALYQGAASAAPFPAECPSAKGGGALRSLSAHGRGSRGLGSLIAHGGGSRGLQAPE